MRKANQYSEAFKEGFNVVGLASVVALSAALLNPLPLLAGVIAEAVYLLFVSDSQWYERRLAKRYDAEVEQRRKEIKDQIIPTLRPDLQHRFARLEETRKAMESSPMHGENWFRDVLRKLDYLLERFLQFAAKESDFREHLRSLLAEVRGEESPTMVYYPTERNGQKNQRKVHRASPRVPSSGPSSDRAADEIVAHFDNEMAQVKRQLEAEKDETSQAILTKRLDLLERRKEFASKLSKIMTNYTHHLELLEDTFGVINDQIRVRTPEEVIADIDDVVFQTDTMVQVLEELAPYEQMAARLSM